MPNRWQRSKQADDAARRDRTRAYVQNVSTANLRRAHLADRNGSGRKDGGHSRSEKLDRRNQNQISEHAAGAHNRSDAWPDDVTDTQKRRRYFRRDRSGLEWRAENFFGSGFPAFEAGHEHLINKPNTQAREGR